MPYADEVGTRLKEWRESRDWKREDLASKSGIPLGTVRNHETGVTTPKSEHLLAYDALGVDVTWLVTGRVSTGNDEDAFFSGGDVDFKLLFSIIVSVEEWLDRHSRRVDARRRAEFIVVAYQFCVEDEEGTERSPMDAVPSVVERFLRLVR